MASVVVCSMRILTVAIAVVLAASCLPNTCLPNYSILTLVKLFTGTKVIIYILINIVANIFGWPLGRGIS